MEILDTKALIDPLENKIPIQVQAGQEEQDPESIPKQNLIFPSGESLPRCWLDADYQTNGK
ncbi:acetyltransferase [Kovacikia minuta CCNUW1]|uniref:acetyltransferase n=1 Tax=Kovacikia minuta TaxID=2931930 RepID=UPI001CC9AC0C|nr:acetyltransferase [Kovacikia minuta CCNUW1]